MRTRPLFRFLRSFSPLSSSPHTNNRHRSDDDDGDDDGDEYQPLLYAREQHLSPAGTVNPRMTVWTIAAACISGLGGFLFGFDLGVVGGLFIAPSFQSHFGIDPNDKLREAHINGNIVAVLQLGCLVGSFGATLTADKLGRKWSIVIAAVVFSIGGFLQILGMSLDMLYAGRFIAGIGVGGLSMLVPIYVAEIAHQSQRGLLGGLWQFFIAAGLTLSYWTNYFVQRLVKDPMDDALWRVPLIIQTVPGVLLFFGMFLLFETPRYLVAHNQYDQACQILSKIRGWPLTDPRLMAEADQIKSGIMRTDHIDDDSQKQVGWGAIIAKPNRRRLFVGLSLQALQQMTGTNVINYYSPVIFRSIGLSSNASELLATGVYGLIKMCVVLLGFLFLVDRYGRRELLMGGGVAMGVCMLSVAICVGTLSTTTTTVVDMTANDENAIQPGSYAGIMFMYLYAVFFVLSWGPIPWIYCSEIYPMAVRAKSGAVTTAVNWVFNAIVGKVSPLFLAKSTVGTYIFFGLFCFFNAIYCFFWVPETKGKTLEETQALFESSPRSPLIGNNHLTKDAPKLLA